MKGLIVGLLTVLLVVGMVSPLLAENAGDKLTRGLVNFSTGWIELPKQIHQTSKESNPFAGILFGSIKGLGYSAARMGTGAFDSVTFAIPPYDKPLIEPKYAF